VDIRLADADVWKRAFSMQPGSNYYILVMIRLVRGKGAAIELSFFLDQKALV